MKADVEQTNALLKSIGGGVNLDMTGLVERQVRGMLERLKTEVQHTAKQTGQSFTQLGGSIHHSASEMESLVNTTHKLNANGAVSVTQKGFDALGRTLTEVYRNGRLLTKTLRTDSGLTKDIAYANELYAEQAAHLKRIYNLKIQRVSVQSGSSKALDLDSQIADTGRLLDANNELIALLDQQAITRSKLVNLHREEARLAARLAQAETVGNSGAPELKRMQQAYTQLAAAYQNYNAAVKANNQAGKAYWIQSARSVSGEIQAMGQKLSSLS